MAPEFYRKIYKENPPKIAGDPMKDVQNNLVAETSWQEIVNNSRR
jgi:hypothetical protein